MFGAKLFSIAAVAIALIALAPIWPSLLMLGTYFVVWRHAILAFALLCGLFAGFYYLADRLLAHRLRKGLVLAHFLLWVFPITVLALAIEGLRGGEAPYQLWLSLAGVVPLSFIVGGALFLVNLVRAMVLKA